MGLPVHFADLSVASMWDSVTAPFEVTGLCPEILLFIAQYAASPSHALHRMKPSFKHEL